MFISGRDKDRDVKKKQAMSVSAMSVSRNLVGVFPKISVSDWL